MGDFIEFLAKEKIATKNVKRFPEGKAGIVFAQIDPGKDSANKFIFYREKAGGFDDQKRGHGQSYNQRHKDTRDDRDWTICESIAGCDNACNQTC